MSVIPMPPDDWEPNDFPKEVYPNVVDNTSWLGVNDIFQFTLIINQTTFSLIHLKLLSLTPTGAQVQLKAGMMSGRSIFRPMVINDFNQCDAEGRRQWRELLQKMLDQMQEPK